MYELAVASLCLTLIFQYVLASFVAMCIHTYHNLSCLITCVATIVVSSLNTNITGLIQDQAKPVACEKAVDIDITTVETGC